MFNGSRVSIAEDDVSRLAGARGAAFGPASAVWLPSPSWPGSTWLLSSCPVATSATGESRVSVTAVSQSANAHTCLEPIKWLNERETRDVPEPEWSVAGHQDPYPGLGTYLSKEQCLGKFDWPSGRATGLCEERITSNYTTSTRGRSEVWARIVGRSNPASTYSIILSSGPCLGRGRRYRLPSAPGTASYQLTPPAVDMGRGRVCHASRAITDLMYKHGHTLSVLRPVKLHVSPIFTQPLMEHNLDGK